MKTVMAGCELRIFTLGLCCITTVPVRLGKEPWHPMQTSSSDQCDLCSSWKAWKAADRQHQTGTITRRSWKPREIHMVASV